MIFQIRLNPGTLAATYTFGTWKINIGTNILQSLISLDLNTFYAVGNEAWLFFASKALTLTFTKIPFVFSSD